MEHARMIAAQRQAKDDEIERLTKQNEELRQRLAVEEAHSDKYRCENEELRKQCDTLEFRAGDALDRAVRAEQENEELRNAIDQEMVIAHLGVFNRGDDPVKAIKELMLWSQGVGEYFAKEKLAAVKAQSTEQWNDTMRQKKEWADEKDAEPVATIRTWHKDGDLHAELTDWEDGIDDLPDGQHTLYTTPPTAIALLESLGDWVHERMQQADSNYHNYGDDTAEEYATLKMVLSKIESMMIESLPLINDFNQGETK